MNIIRAPKITALLGLIFLSIQSAWSAESLGEKLSRASKLVDLGKANSAKLILREIIRSNPGNAEAHMLLGAALAALVDNDKYDEAISEEQQAIQLDPKSSGAHRILGMIYANQHKVDDSISELKKACELNPSSFVAHRDLATVYHSAGRKEEAISGFKKAIEIKPDSVDVHSKLAVLLSKKGEHCDAIKEANKAVELKPARAETHMVLANVKLDSGDAAGSIDSFKAAIEANGFDSFGCKNPLTAASALSGLGWAQASQQEPSKTSLDEALKYQRKAIKAYPGFLPAYIRTAELLAKQKKTKEAESMYQDIFRLSKSDATVGTSFARFLVDQGRKEDARAVLKKVLERAPENKQAADALAAIDQPTTK